MDYRIVPLTEPFFEGFRKALDSVARERRYLVFLEAPPPRACHDYLLRTQAHGLPRYVALIDGQVVGWCDIRSLERPAFAHSGVLGLGVVAAMRGQGIGDALLRATLAAAKAQGLTRVELTVRANNARALALYRKFGFELEGCKRNALRVDGVYEDLFCMAILF